ncbi:MAG: type 4a pilus biogenesis protein PilO [Candidatus Sumerlaeia bacterium]|nr:type 4a pilus biogenesis protein PilO [Candidatus Sumerlaeia bacterium]
MALSEKNRQTLLAIVIGGLVLIAGSAYYYFMFAAAEIESNKKVTAEAEQKARDARRELANLQALIANDDQRELMKRLVDRVKTKLPSDPESTEFFRFVEETLRRTGVSMSRLAPEDPVARELFIEVPFSMRGGARYHEFGQLLNVVECSPERLMRVAEFKIDNDPARPSVHPIEVMITTFTFNEAGAKRAAR